MRFFCFLLQKDARSGVLLRNYKVGVLSTERTAPVC